MCIANLAFYKLKCINQYVAQNYMCWRWQGCVVKDDVLIKGIFDASYNILDNVHFRTF